jgi:hypothetical protein
MWAKPYLKLNAGPSITLRHPRSRSFGGAPWLAAHCAPVLRERFFERPFSRAPPPSMKHQLQSLPGSSEVMIGCCVARNVSSLLVLRIVAAADVTAGSAETKVQPCVAHGEALFAPCGIGAVGHHELEMAALGRHERINPGSARRAMRSCVDRRLTPTASRHCCRWAACAGAFRSPRTLH